MARWTGWDSNPRGLLTPHDFQSCSLSLSDTRPDESGAAARPIRRTGNPQRRGWDSNPRGPCEPDGLANRCRNHLATSPNRRPRGRPATPLPLLGSNQDSPDPESGVLPITPRGIEKPECRARSRIRHARGKAQSGRRGSNPRPSAWEADALPTELLPHPARRTLAARRRSAEPPLGFEPRTARLRIECSTPELRWRALWCPGHSREA